jgi:hypothetical protein
MERALAELEALSKRRYKAVYYITDYGSPRLIRRKNRPRSEWVPGVLAAWLVVHDVENGEALCQAQIIARNDVTDEPIRQRLRSQVRERLLRELGNEVRARSAVALGRISSTLKLP